MSKLKPIAALLTLLTAGLVSACDLSASLLDSVGGPTSLCTDVGQNRCPRPVVHPDDLKPN